ncbi:hypothetical protein BH11MYX1_BH11MYX1_48770 [soil metagenome]
MRLFLLLAFLVPGCEHDPRFERHVEAQRADPAIVHPAIVHPAIAHPGTFPVVNATVQRTPVVPPTQPRHHRRH